ncbi:MnhB domain-containing protein [Pontiella sp.]|uniref:MnhB domain-containing protein n=1 Tax=Pontiella sp. TaxID=2837462 RepID=UPI00356B5D43
MRWVYLIAITSVFLRLAFLAPAGDTLPEGIAEIIVAETQVPNSVAGVLLHNRLYDTIFEVFVFTLAVLGIQFALSLHGTEKNEYHISDPTMVIMARIAAMVQALIFVELAVRGHLAPGGGFAAGVAGGTAVGLVVLSRNVHTLYEAYQRWHVATIEKVLVLLILLIAGTFLFFSGTVSAGRPLSIWLIPLLNILIALKVALGSWTIVLLFIRHRGLL